MTETYSMGFWTAKAGEEDAFVAAWTESAVWIREQPGVRALRLVRDLKEPAKFISFADWDGIDSIHAWKSSPEFKERIGRVRQPPTPSPRPKRSSRCTSPQPRPLPERPHQPCDDREGRNGCRLHAVTHWRTCRVRLCDSCRPKPE